MHIPGAVPLSPPHTATWVGLSGRRYDFAVTRPGISWIDNPAVYILARREGHKITPLFVGETESLQRRFGVSFERCPEDWGRAMALGMTHVHLRFEGRSLATRADEVRDLAASLRPLLNDDPAAAAPMRVRHDGVLHPAPRPASGSVVYAAPEPEEFASEPGVLRAAETAAAPASLVLVPESAGAPGRVAANPKRSGLFGRLLRLVRSPANDPAAALDAGSDDVLRGRTFEQLPRHTPKAAAPLGEPAQPASGSPLTPTPLLAAASIPVTTHAPDEVIATEVAPIDDEIVAAVEPSARGEAKPAEAEAVIAVGQVAPAVDAEPAISAAVAAAKAALDIDAAAPVVLFADELSHAAGADLLLEAMITVAREHSSVHLVLAGEGPLRLDLQARAVAEGLAPRCRFVGHVPSEAFAGVLAAADVVAVPARTQRLEGLARLALAAGKPLLVTHQSRIGCVEHGRTGLITYDNPGSFVWGVRELLGPLSGTVRRALAHAA